MVNYKLALPAIELPCTHILISTFLHCKMTLKGSNVYRKSFKARIPTPKAVVCKTGIHATPSGSNEQPWFFYKHATPSGSVNQIK